MTPTPDRRPLVAAATTIGIGLGGFFDGILFHQILQVHNMLSNTVPRTTLANEQVNMFWDGLFHAFCYVTLILGLWLLWRAVTRPAAILCGRTFFWSIILGWGVFNLVEGLIDHQILQLHHVYQNGNHLLWDLLFLASGVVLTAVGGSDLYATRAGALPR